MPDLNPLEELTEEMADIYTELVYELVETLAPVRPWWVKALSADEQLWRWVGSAEKPGPRLPVLAWLMEAAAYFGAKDATEALAKIEEIFESPAAPTLIPPEVVSEIPLELLEIVQANGAKEAGQHIRKMEKMVEGRMQAVALLNQPDQPDVASTPPVEPIVLPGETRGWPSYGGQAELAQAADAALG